MHGSRSRKYIQNDVDEYDDNDDDNVDDNVDDDDDNNDDNDDEVYYSSNSVNFQARTSRFCMKVF